MKRWIWMMLLCAGCGVTVPNNDSSGVIVNVQKQGAVVATWDLYLLHGTNTISEKQSEIFSLDPGAPSLAATAQEFADSGQRVRLTYTHYGFWPCAMRIIVTQSINDCDVVTGITAIR